MNFPIFDLHCDLLCYLANDPNRTAFDPGVRCSIPQLREGNVQFQVLPIFTTTEKGSAKLGLAQAEIYKKIAKELPCKTSLAIENASSMCEEDEPLRVGLERIEKLGPLFYISLTWNFENRFGGGAHTDVGLKQDGKDLVRFLDNKNIAIDLSHTSDALAYDLLNYMEKNSLKVPVIASHSNFRSVTDMARNLPDELVKEVIARNGIIGMNFVRFFVGPDSPTYFAKQLEHGLKLGGENHLCLGADFFFGDDVPPDQRKSADVTWFPGYDNASCYSKVFQLWNEQLGLKDALLKKISHENLNHFTSKYLCKKN